MNLLFIAIRLKNMFVSFCELLTLFPLNFKVKSLFLHLFEENQNWRDFFRPNSAKKTLFIFTFNQYKQEYLYIWKSLKRIIIVPYIPYTGQIDLTNLKPYCIAHRIALFMSIFELIYVINFVHASHF